MRFSEVLQIVRICAGWGVRHAVISPGSRSAPLIVGFARHPLIETHVVPDERTAGYIGLGLAQQTGSPVILICTSGTAAVNYSPAMAEAWYQNIPLVAMTADRPPEWIDQGDGQTIHQENLYTDFIKARFLLTVDSESVENQQQIFNSVHSALEIATTPAYGPIHVNIPFAEPFYTDIPKISGFPDPPIIEKSRGSVATGEKDLVSLISKINDFNKILIVAGQLQPDVELAATLENLEGHPDVAIIAECHSNLHQVNGVIQQPDLIFRNYLSEDYLALKPDLLISIGASFISKPLKNVIRGWNPTNHWHVQEAGKIADVFQSNPTVILRRPVSFFIEVIHLKLSRNNSQYCSRVKRKSIEAGKHLEKTVVAVEPLSELSAVSEILKSLPAGAVLHLGNSMPVRWVNLCGLSGDITVFANRGTSGIDGVLSTAVGHSMAGPEPNVVLLGDLSFFYDRNALWHNELGANLRIILLNNHGGGIFNLINGPRALPECDRYFITEQRLTARNVARDHNLEYYHIDSLTDLKKKLPEFFTATGGQSKLLEIETMHEQNSSIYTQLIQTG